MPCLDRPIVAATSERSQIDIVERVLRAGLPRGYLRLRPREQQTSVMLTLGLHGDWQPAHAFATAGVALELRNILSNAMEGTSASDLLSRLATAAPLGSAMQLLQVRASCAFCGHC